MIEVLHNDKNLIVCIKPSGTLSEFNVNSPISLPAILMKENNISEIFCVHRLDKEVSGVMIYAKNAKAAAELSKQINEGIFKKEYLASVHGKVSKETDSFVDLLYHDKSKNKTYVVNRERRGVKRAELNYNLVKYIESDDVSVVNIELLTGRTHQIRVQFASRGLPICGDRKYGADDDIKPMRLHSRKITFVSLTNGSLLSFTSVPEWLK